MARDKKIDALREAIAELPDGTKENAAYAALCGTGEPVAREEFRELWLDRLAGKADLATDPITED